MFAHSAIISVATKEEKAVAKTRPSKFRPVTERILGLTATVRQRRVRRERMSSSCGSGLCVSLDLACGSITSSSDAGRTDVRSGEEGGEAGADLRGEVGAALRHLEELIGGRAREHLVDLVVSLLRLDCACVKMGADVCEQRVGDCLVVLSPRATYTCRRWRRPSCSRASSCDHRRWRPRNPSGMTPYLRARATAAEVTHLQTCSAGGIRCR